MKYKVIIYEVIDSVDPSYYYDRKDKVYEQTVDNMNLQDVIETINKEKK